MNAQFWKILSWVIFFFLPEANDEDDDFLKNRQGMAKCSSLTINVNFWEILWHNYFLEWRMGSKWTKKRAQEHKISQNAIRGNRSHLTLLECWSALGLCWLAPRDADWHTQSCLDFSRFLMRFCYYYFFFLLFEKYFLSILDYELLSKLTSNSLNLFRNLVKDYKSLP